MSFSLSAGGSKDQALDSLRKALDTQPDGQRPGAEIALGVIEELLSSDLFDGKRVVVTAGGHVPTEGTSPQPSFSVNIYEQVTQ